MTKNELDSRYIAFENDHTYLKTTCTDKEDITYLSTDISTFEPYNDVTGSSKSISDEKLPEISTNLNVPDPNVFLLPGLPKLDFPLCPNIKLLQNKVPVQNVNTVKKSCTRPILPKIKNSIESVSTIQSNVLIMPSTNTSTNTELQNVTPKKHSMKPKSPMKSEKNFIIKPVKNKINNVENGARTIKLSYNLFKLIQSGGKLFMCVECDKIYTQHKDLLDHQITHKKCDKNINAQKKSEVVINSVQKKIITENKIRSFDDNDFVQQTKPIFEPSVNSKKRKTIFMGECIICHSVFPDLGKHIKTVHQIDLNKNKLHRCNKCDMEFDIQQQLHAHEMSAHKIVYPHTCEHCYKDFSLKEDLDIHYKTHTNDSVNCSQNNDNMKYTHNSDYMKYLCPYCDAGFPYSIGLRIHLAKHIGKNNSETPTSQIEYSPSRPFEQIDKLFSELNRVSENTDGVYINHGIDNDYQLMLLKEDGSNKLSLDTCIDKDTKISLKLNEDSHTDLEINESPLEVINDDDNILNQQQTTSLAKKRICYTVCRICMNIVCYSKIGKHMKKKHNNAAPYKCEICRAVFFRKHIMDDHRRKHTNSKPHKCLECSKGFTYKHHLNRHMMIVHNADSLEKPFKCSVCDKAFSFKEYLTLHVNSRHSGKHYMCQICGKSFSTNAALNKHQLCHSNERPFMCEHCGRTFKCKTHCDTHKKNMHPGGPRQTLQPEKFECNLCNKKFSTKVYRDMHFKRHNGQGHQCDICFKLFVSKAHMHRHKRLMHKN